MFNVQCTMCHVPFELLGTWNVERGTLNMEHH